MLIYVGLELIRLSKLAQQRQSIKYWCDPSGSEVDWIVENADGYIPVEVKWTEAPGSQDAKYLQTFLDEYKQAAKASR